jgi:hypothetical protein
MKGACGPLAGDTPRIGTKRTNRILGNRENAKEQVGVQGLIKRYISNGLHTRTSDLHWLSVLSHTNPHPELKICLCPEHNLKTYSKHHLRTHQFIQTRNNYLIHEERHLEIA